MEIVQNIREKINTKIKVMSDSIKKYHELVEEGVIFESPDRGKTVRQRPLLNWIKEGNVYTELELVEVVADIARQFKGASPKVLLALAKDELSIRKVCD